MCHPAVIKQLGGASVKPSISADGRYIAYASNAINLVPDDTNGIADIFVYDRKKKITTRVSVNSDGSQAVGTGAQGSIDPEISADGRYVVFSSKAENLVTGDNNGVSDVFIHDMVTHQTKLVSVTSGGDFLGNNHSSKPSVSSYGRYVVYQSAATNLVSGDAPNQWEVYMFDTSNSTTRKISAVSDTVNANNRSIYPRITPNGRFVTYVSFATNLDPADNNPRSDVYLYNSVTDSTMAVSKHTLGVMGNRDSSFSSVPVISPDGRYIVFESSASNFVSDDSNRHVDIYKRDVSYNSRKSTDLIVTQRFSVAEAKVDQVISVDVSVFNRGEDVAYPVLLTNVLPDGSAIQRVEIKQASGWCIKHRIMNCLIRYIRPGTRAIVQVYFKPTANVWLFNTASANAPGFDRGMVNNRSQRYIKMTK